MHSSKIFDRDGYVILPGVFSEEVIDGISGALEAVKNRKWKPSYFSQATHRYRKVCLDQFNYIDESMLGFTRNKFLGELSRLSENLLLSKEMKIALSEVFPYYEEFVMQNNMLFDRSMETLDHIDSWYLDTLPKGALFGAFVALEDISPCSGPFRVYPGSHKLVHPHALQGLSHDDFIEEISRIKSNLSCIEFCPRRGDLLLWHSWLIHGASRVTDHSYSRKSLTAHYAPLNSSFQTSLRSRPRSVFYSIRDFFLRRPNRSKRHSIFQLYTPLMTCLENIKYMEAFLKSAFSRKSSFGEIVDDMRAG